PSDVCGFGNAATCDHPSTLHTYSLVAPLPARYSPEFEYATSHTYSGGENRLTQPPPSVWHRLIVAGPPFLFTPVLTATTVSVGEHATPVGLLTGPESRKESAPDSVETATAGLSIIPHTTNRQRR